MKKIILFSILLITFFAPDLMAQFKLDTLTRRYVGPGVLHMEFVEKYVPLNINVLEIDLKNPYIKMETVKAKDKYVGMEIVSSMASRKSYEGHRVVGAINGDFYDMSNGKPINIQVVNGQVMRRPANKLSTIGINEDNKPLLNFVSFDGVVVAKGKSQTITGVNETRNTNMMVLYNDLFGASTSTNDYGSEILIKPMSGWVVNDTMTFTVESMLQAKGNMAIPAGYGVLSAHGTSQEFINANIKAGDTIKVYMGLAGGIPKLTQLMGGYPKIVADGKNYAIQGVQEEGGPDHAYNREPRTGAGFSADSSKFYFITVDGRLSNSIGVTLKDLADIMLHFGIAWGINLDGGGSTTMVVNSQVVNKIAASASERSVANGLIVVSTAPKDTELHSIYTMPHKVKVFRDYTVQLNLTASDKYYNPMSVDNTLISYSVDPSIGTIDSKGLFKAGQNPAQGYVYINYKGLKDSVLVTVKDIVKAELTPDNIVVDNRISQKFILNGWDEDNLGQTVPVNDIKWSLSNNNIGAIASDGTFKGAAEGISKVIATYRGISDTVTVKVEIGEVFTTLDSLENNSGWNFSVSDLVDSAQSNFSLSDLNSLGSNSFKIHYELTYASMKSYSVSISKETPIYGMPDSIYVDFQTDSSLVKPTFIFSDDNDELYSVAASSLLNSIDKFSTSGASLKLLAALGKGQTLNYPLKLQRIDITITGKKTVGKKYSETIYVDNLRVTYPQKTSDVDDEMTNVITGYNLYQNYPNPFNPATMISYDLEQAGNISLKVFDLLGREVATIFEGFAGAGNHMISWNAQNVPSGIYFYRLNAGNYTMTRKMVLVR